MVISSPEDLLEFKKTLEHPTVTPTAAADKTITWRLTQDIDMSGTEWSPINPILSFERSKYILDGGGHCIYGLNCRQEIGQHTPYVVISPCAAAKDPLFVKPAGLLFCRQKHTFIRDLTVKGTLDLSGIEKSIYMRVSVGGLSGVLDDQSSVENCRVETDTVLPEAGSENGYARGYLRFGGIAGANSGSIIGCVYSGNLAQEQQDIQAAGIAFYTRGFIKNSYAEYSLLPEVGKGRYRTSKSETFRCWNNAGMVDNIELYMPRGPFYSGSLEKFFRSETIKALLDADILLSWSVKMSYWEQEVIGKIARVIETSAAEGAGFGTRESGAAALSVYPFQHQNELRLCRSRYSRMFERLIAESSEFRRGILAEYDEDPEGVMKTISNFMTSARRAESILKKAQRHRDYDRAVNADKDFTDWAYER